MNKAKRKDIYCMKDKTDRNKMKLCFVSMSKLVYVCLGRL